MKIEVELSFMRCHVNKLLKRQASAKKAGGRDALAELRALREKEEEEREQAKKAVAVARKAAGFCFSAQRHSALEKFRLIALMGPWEVWKVDLLTVMSKDWIL